MSKLWITSDLHIGHDKEFIYKDRGFKNQRQHDEKLVENWNSLVNTEDTVYILGDVMLMNAVNDREYTYGLSVLESLNGMLHIIRGNHDSTDKIERYMECKNVKSAGDAALYLEYPSVGKYHFYLSHYPALVSHEKLKSLKNAVINLYGHTHQVEHFYENHPYMYCVCLDAHNMKPVLIDDIIEEIKSKKSSYESC